MTVGFYQDKEDFQYMYIAPGLDEWGAISNNQLHTFTERHKLQLVTPSLTKLTLTDNFIKNSRTRGVILEVKGGKLDTSKIKIAEQVLKSNKSAFLYWPLEQMVEVLDADRLKSYKHLWSIFRFFRFYKTIKYLIKDFLLNPRFVIREYYRLTNHLLKGQSYQSNPRLEGNFAKVVQQLSSHTSPIPFLDFQSNKEKKLRINGLGVYLRADFWSRNRFGGSYSHTCYVAKELANITKNLICFMPHRYPLLDDLGVEQVVLPSPGADGEEIMLQASFIYYDVLRIAIEVLKPAYLYERLCLGNFVGARLSQELKIPYIVEYNGSEISMKHSFEGDRYKYESLYLQAEEAAFNQASVICVVSDPVKQSLIQRGVDSAKILVNPNGVDPKIYRPADISEKMRLRTQFGWSDANCVVGFSGTFGRWHGIDILAKSIPQICQRLPDVRFLLIGDGNCSYLIDDMIERYSLTNRIHRTGKVSQTEVSRLLKVCDICVAPHNLHMFDSPFFGSPVKVFEYMATGCGIVASELEQIGQILSPALKGSQLSELETISNQRAVLCSPGDVKEFVNAITFLAERPDVINQLGNNARKAVLKNYSWETHVHKLWSFIQVSHSLSEEQNNNFDIIVTRDLYKDEIQKQWNNNPVGTQYAKQSEVNTLEWFLEIEVHRYKVYAPWMPETMEFKEHPGKKVLEIGGGVGTDLCQFAQNGSIVTDLDLSLGHLELARQNFRLRGLTGKFIHYDAEELPFEDNSFDIVYSNGVIHHTPNTVQVLHEIFRVLKPGGKAIIMVYAEDSLHYWLNLVWNNGLNTGLLEIYSMGEIMSQKVEVSENNSKPLVKVYTKKRIKCLFKEFDQISILKRQLTVADLPRRWNWFPVDLAQRYIGWNLVVKASKPL